MEQHRLKHHKALNSPKVLFRVHLWGIKLCFKICQHASIWLLKFKYFRKHQTFLSPTAYKIFTQPWCDSNTQFPLVVVKCKGLHHDEVNGVWAHSAYIPSTGTMGWVLTLLMQNFWSPVGWIFPQLIWHQLMLVFRLIDWDTVCIFINV